MIERLGSSGSGNREVAFHISIPVKNLMEFLPSCLFSVLSSATQARVHIHVRLDSSSIEELGFISSAQEIIDKLPNFTLSRSAGVDSNVAHALQVSLSSVSELESDGYRVFLGWLGADDLLQSAALDNLLEILTDYPEIRFLGGRRSVVTEKGVLMQLDNSPLYSQYDLATGQADSNSKPFLQAEGVFFDHDLLIEAGGFNTNLRLAFDYDLWVRIARLEPYSNVDALVGTWRRRSGQLSAATASYLSEIESAKVAHKKDLSRGKLASGLSREIRLIKRHAGEERFRLGEWQEPEVPALLDIHAEHLRDVAEAIISGSSLTSQSALDLLLLAQRIRPEGPVIRRMIQELKAIEASGPR
jgi:hypothetical protein